MYVNGLFSGARTSTDNFTAYINPYLVVSKGGNYTKHIYIGSQRIVSKLGDLDSYGQDPRRIAYAGSEVDGASVDFAGKYRESQQTLKDRYTDFGVEYRGEDNDDYVNGGGFCCDDAPALRAGTNDNPETFQYYYHSDHLGSTSLITNLDGEIVQHVEYVPFGEVFIEERNNTWNTPYLFNAKELDEETGLYYYGARYYDSRVSVWLGVDPMWEKYPNISTYHYCHYNPLKYIDPTGMFDIETGTVEKGDNLTKITKQINDKFDTKLTINEIAGANGIKDANKIQIGDKIALPGENVELNFDLENLTLTDSKYSLEIQSWTATSGREGYQSSEYQNVKDKGPLPEGSYTVDPARTQEWKNNSTFQKAIAQVGRGAWRGGTKSWGEYRTWITPMEGTNTYGRSGFSIHGGTIPGSAGCIDLTKDNNAFHSWLKSYGQTIRLNVQYGGK
jgi:RHS repeat-associated protein